MIKITCPSCRKVHKKTDESLLGKIVKCKDCGFTFKVSDGSQPVQWYWMQNGQMKGPIDVAGLKELVCSGHLKPTDMIRRVGADWVVASQVKGLFQESKLKAANLPVLKMELPNEAIKAEIINSPPPPPPPLPTPAPVLEVTAIPVETRTKVVISADDSVRCPKCGSDSVSLTKEGFSGGKGCCGAIIFGPLGVLCGTCGSKKMYNVCMKCGHKWRVGK